ncbi:hypothetical protein JXM67_02490 [candidate division WOR-3 bacterium]|nr:hypothetical protein [candidate division WOR-3 bacterium]
MAQSELLVAAYNSLSGAALYLFGILIVLLTILYLYKTRDAKTRKIRTIKALIELLTEESSGKDTLRFLSHEEIIAQAHQRFTELKARDKIEPGLLLALDYRLKALTRLKENEKKSLMYLLTFLFLGSFMLAFGLIALFISAWLGPGQRVTVMVFEVIPGIFAVVFMVYAAIKMLGWPDRPEALKEKPGAKPEGQE